MTKEQSARVDKLKTYLRYAKTDNLETIIVSVKDIEEVLELAIKSQKEIENFKIANNEAWEEWNNLEQSSYEEEMKLKKENEKKDINIKKLNKYLERISRDLNNVAIDQIPIAIAELKYQNKLKNKQIDLMARAFRQDDVRSVEEIKEYFEKQAKEKGD